MNQIMTSRKRTPPSLSAVQRVEDRQDLFFFFILIGQKCNIEGIITEFLNKKLRQCDSGRENRFLTLLNLLGSFFHSPTF